MEPYTAEFYRDHKPGVRRSANEIVPLVLRLVGPRSVVDVGCGLGVWLEVFREHGVQDVLGIDGSYIDQERLEIPREHFLAMNLEEPVRLGRAFDLVLSLEVAEHLPGACAESFVEFLTVLGPAVMFSAAIPYQGGTHHVNEQWPDYWAAQFKKNGYVTIDCIRKRIWEKDSVEWWYAQNTLLFVRPDFLKDHPELHEELERTSTAQLSIVHPRQYLHSVVWPRKTELVRQDIGGSVPPNERLILVDEEKLRVEVAGEREVVPFLEREGEYWGPPPDDETAKRELERLRDAGAGFIAFAWPAFWWLERYSGLRSYLASAFDCVLRNDRVVIFDLRRRKTFR